MADALERLAAALADRYRIERELGAGGMATVYLAHDLRHVAMADTATRPELAVAIYRLRDDDDAAISAFERVVDGPDVEGIYLPQVLASLAPELVARPRTQAAIARLFERLRERYGHR